MNNVDITRYSKRMLQLLWDPEPRNDDTLKSPIWCLGTRYDTENLSAAVAQQSGDIARPTASSRPQLRGRDVSSAHSVTTLGSFETLDTGHSEEQARNGESIINKSEDWPEAFLNDFESRYRFTYRTGFLPIQKSNDPKANASMTMSVRLKSQLLHQNGFMSDTGWGCMIRSGQSVLANALAMSRNKRGETMRINTPQDKEILNWFADDPRAPFSIHKFVDHGAKACGTFPGQWFGPSATAKCIETLTSNFDHAGLKVYVTGDGPDVFEDILYQVAYSGPKEFTPTLMLVGTRLGIDRVTPAYWDALRGALQMPQSVGIAGGRPSSSHYFVGTQGSNFFYLDPHQTQNALTYQSNPDAMTLDEVFSCHTRRLRRMDIGELDPSMLIAFLFRDQADWLAWRQQISAATGKAIFHVADSAPVAYDSGATSENALQDMDILDDTDDESVLQ